MIWLKKKNKQTTNIHDVISFQVFDISIKYFMVLRGFG